MAAKVARMTPQTEEKITDAVEDVVDMINDGEDPNAAIVKVAAERQLSPGHVGFLVNAYNTARANRQREGSRLLSEKSADYPVADPGTIFDRLFPKQVKSAAQLQREQTVSPDYDLPPTWLGRARGRAAFEKRAEAGAPKLTDKEVVPYDRDPAERAKRAYHAATWRERQVEESRRLFSAAQDGLVARFQKLAAWFDDAANPTVADVRDNVEALWGREGAAILNHLEGSRPRLTKRACKLSSPGPVDRRAEPYRTIEETIGQTATVKAAGEAYASARAEADARTAEELAPFAPARRGSPLGLPSPESSVEKQAGPYTTALGVQLTRDMLGHIGGGLEVPDKEKMVDKALRQISSPEHEQELRGIHTQSMLHNMLANDPIISSYRPTEVTDAFNQVSQLAPNAAGQPAVVGPLLRKWLQQGNLDTFEGDQVVGTEHKLKQINAPSPGKGPAGHGTASGSILAK